MKIAIKFNYKKDKKIKVVEISLKKKINNPKKN